MVPSFLVRTALMALSFVSCSFGDREHKVHNIVLYPDRHSWCQTTPIKQIVASPGYEPTTIDNNVCVGACFSYSIPRTQPAEPGELIGPYCDSCQPAETMCYHVTLKADDKNLEGPKTIKKRVEIIMNCSCISCEKIQNKDCEISDQNTSELPTDLFSILHPNTNTTNPEPGQSAEDVPELMDISQRNRTQFIAVDQVNKEENNEKVIRLLKSILEQEDDTETNINYDKAQLKELLEILEEHKQELSKVNLMQFVSFVDVHNSEDLQLDLSKLKDVLEDFQKSKNLTQRHRLFGLGTDLGAKNNQDIEDDLEALAQKYDLPENFGIEGSRAGLSYHKGNHIGMGIQSNAVSSGSKHHYVGEEQHVGLDSGHLVVGPHGSLVINPDHKARERLHLDADLVTPNQEGLVLSYENHPRNHHKVVNTLEDEI